VDNLGTIRLTYHLPHEVDSALTGRRSTRASQG
jgi:hypothetical protein